MVNVVMDDPFPLRSWSAAAASPAGARPAALPLHGRRHGRWCGRPGGPAHTRTQAPQPNAAKTGACAADTATLLLFHTVPMRLVCAQTAHLLKVVLNGLRQAPHAQPTTASGAAPPHHAGERHQNHRAAHTPPQPRVSKADTARSDGPQQCAAWRSSGASEGVSGAKPAGRSAGARAQWATTSAAQAVRWPPRPRGRQRPRWVAAR